jgi:hypothetical protein
MVRETMLRETILRMHRREVLDAARHGPAMVGAVVLGDRRLSRG